MAGQTINQEFSIDVAAALKALQALDAGYAKLETRINSLAKSMGNFSGASRQVDTLGNAFQSNIPAAVQQTERLTTSLGLLSRIVFTQAVVRGLNTIRRQMEETAKRAAEFQKQIALATTIADGASFDQIGKAVRSLSDDFNIDLLQSASGVYQALSNQVGDFGESIRFTEEAARFAKATNSSLADSVDLLSAALKGYGLKVDDVDKVSSIFFATIDKGRINASELANSFGRVDTIAADLGVSLEETGGALAAISVRGTKTSEALTQFRAILSALQKPSEDMAKKLEELGFTSSEVAIKTLGLTGVLDELSKSTGGSAEQLAKLFPNIRGLSGVASLTSDDLAELTANIDEMTTAGRNFNKEKFLVATSTDAERVTAEFNKLKNEMTLGLGSATLKAADDFFKLTGGADSLISTVKIAIPVIAGLSAAMLGFKLQAAAANAELGLLAKGLGALSLIPIAAGIGTSAGSFIEDKRLDSLFKDLRGLEAEDKAFLAEFTGNQKAQRDEFNRTTDERVKAALVANRELNRAYLQDVANARNAEEQKRAGEKFLRGTPVDEGKLSKLLGRSFPTPDSVSRGIIDAGKEAATLKQQVDSALAGEEGIDRLKGNIDSLFQTLSKLEPARLNTDQGLQKQYADLLQQLQQLRNDSDITAEELNKVIDTRNKLGTGVFEGDSMFNIDRLGFSSSLNALDEMLSKFQQIQSVESQIGDVAPLQSRLQSLNEILRQAAPEVPFQNIQSALSSAVLPAERIADAMERSATAAERASSAASGFNPVGRFNGGPMNYFASGGHARGLDTIPAMLSAGEHVINAKSAQRFRSQIQAINAGQNPVFRQDGGTVNNTNIGDVSIRVDGSKNPEMTVRTIAQKLKREVKRGTV